jgi:hypothetical protein
MRLVTSRAHELLGAHVSVRPGGRGVADTLAALAGVLCAEGSKGELGELRAFAQSELAARPGAGLSDVVEATDPAKCTPVKPRVALPKKPKRSEPNLPKDYKDR